MISQQRPVVAIGPNGRSEFGGVRWILQQNAGSGQFWVGKQHGDTTHSRGNDRHTGIEVFDDGIGQAFCAKPRRQQPDIVPTWVGEGRPCLMPQESHTWAGLRPQGIETRALSDEIQRHADAPFPKLVHGIHRSGPALQGLSTGAHHTPKRTFLILRFWEHLLRGHDAIVHEPNLFGGDAHALEHCPLFRTLDDVPVRFAEHRFAVHRRGRFRPIARLPTPPKPVRTWPPKTLYPLSHKSIGLPPGGNDDVEKSAGVNISLDQRRFWVKPGLDKGDVALFGRQIQDPAPMPGPNPGTGEGADLRLRPCGGEVGHNDQDFQNSSSVRVTANVGAKTVFELFSGPLGFFATLPPKLP